MKLSVLAVAITWSSLAQAGTQAVYYADSNLGLDSNPGSLESPFQTLEMARDAVRTINGSMTGDIVVYLRGGTFSLSQALTLDAQDSGNNGFRVIYRNYPDEEPIIDGGRPITGWTALSNGIYSASANSKVFNQLYVNNRPAQRARYPEYGSPYKIIANNDAAQQIRINKDEIENWSNLNRVQMVIASSFTSCRLRIDSFTTNGTEAVVTPMDPERAAYWGWLEGPLDGTPSYYFENHFDFLDTPGEWFLDVDTDTVYYIPRADEDMSTANVYVPELEELLHVEDTENLTLFGLTFQQAAWLEPMTNGMVQRQGSMRVLASYDETNGWSTKQFNVLPTATYFKGINNVRIERCLFTKMGAAAMGFDTGTTNNTVVGNVFSEIAESAIIYDIDNNRWATGDELSSLDLFDSNYFFRIGTLYYGGTGLFAFWPDRISITHNEFSQINGLGMNVGWGATYDTTATKEPLVANNRIHDTSIRALDSGGIHTKSDMSDALITENWIYNITKRSWWDIGPDRHSHGVYLDDNSQNATVSSNVFMNINSTDIKVKGNGHTFVYNGSQDQSIKDESGIRPEYIDIKEFWCGGAIGRDLEPSEAYTNAPVELDTLFDDSFDAEEVGAQPSGYLCDTSGGTIEIVDVPGSGNQSVRMTDSDSDNASGARLNRNLGEQSETMSCEFRMKAGQTDNSMFFILKDAGGAKACHVGFSGNGYLRFYYQSGEYTDIDSYSVGTWYTFRIEADVEKQTFSLWIDDALVLGDSLFFAPTAALATIEFYNTFSTGFFDLDYLTVKGAGSAGNSVPVAEDQAASVLHGDSVAISLGGSDMDGDSLSYAVAALPINGTLSGTAPDLVYTPTNSTASSDGFTYTVSDGQTNSAPATVSIQISLPLIYQDGFDNDGLDINTNGTGGGAASVDLGGGAGWADGGTATYSNGDAWWENAALLYSTNSFQSYGGFELAVTYYAESINVQGRNLFSFGLLESADSYSGANNPFVKATTAYGIGANVILHSNSSQTRGLWLANGSSNTLLDASGTVQQFVAGENTPVVLRVETDGAGGADWRYSINGFEEATGHIDSFDFSRSFHFAAYGQDNEHVKQLASVTLTPIPAPVPAAGYAGWIAGYGLSGAHAQQDADVENGGVGDGYNNLVEYALGMNPTNSDAGSRESVGTTLDGGTNFFEYVHSRRSGFAGQGLTYLLIDSTNLVDSVSFTNAQNEILVGPSVDGYESVTNRYRTDDPVKYLNLQIRLD
ncbi:Ig-like domain-containing protein [Pontiella desulfatans]|uniref:Ig-like domain-containing protein n=1 Tax=Pontiella desulfatans TaxID=2750659 RepID=UPI0014447ECA|nr:Ig-like domain-containing protein [Pontiella desulfatans]